MQFINGATWSKAQILAVADTSSSANAKPYGTPGTGVFDSRRYAT